MNKLRIRTAQSVIPPGVILASTVTKRYFLFLRAYVTNLE